MKNIFKKNHIIITALMIMIVIAGYLSFTRDDTADDLSVAGTDGIVNDDLAMADDDLNIAADTEDLSADNSLDEDASLVETDDASLAETDGNTTEVADTEDAADVADISDEDILAQDDPQEVADNGEINLEDGVPGEAVLASTVLDSGFFISSKVEREQLRSENKAIYMELIQSPDISEESKQKAIDGMLQLTLNKDKEFAAENLLMAKGMGESVVTILNDKVSVVINSAQPLTDQELAIIEDVVKNETEVSVDKIKITTVVINE
ncbi:MAG: SpoIIIAH-like family protein [Mobilitalea sp.]